MADINVNVNAEPVETNPTPTDVEDNKATETAQEPAKVEEPKEPKKEDKPVEEKKPSKSNGKKTKADLQAQIDMLQTELNNVVDNSADFNEQLSAKDSEIAKLQADVENYKAEIEKLTQAVASVIEDKKNKLPDNMKGLVPEGQDCLATLNWLLKAEGSAPKENPEVQIGRVMPVDRPQGGADNTELSPYERMTSAFAQLFSKK